MDDLVDDLHDPPPVLLDLYGLLQGQQVDTLELPEDGFGVGMLLKEPQERLGPALKRVGS